jgi:hypothetical protein
MCRCRRCSPILGAGAVQRQWESASWDRHCHLGGVGGGGPQTGNWIAHLHECRWLKLGSPRGALCGLFVLIEAQLGRLALRLKASEMPKEGIGGGSPPLVRSPPRIGWLRRLI